MRRLGQHISIAFRDVIQNKWLASSLFPIGLRGRGLRRFGHNIHPTAALKPAQWLGATSGLTVGAHSFINYGCFFDLGAPTIIGAHTHFGYGVKILTCSHEIGSPAKRCGDSTSAPVVVGDGCWIGAGVIVQPGVTIGDGCIVATGSVVVRNCEPNTLYAGVPAVPKGSLPAAVLEPATAVD
jgi:maltose O-acetyltransferase